MVRPLLVPSCSLLVSLLFAAPACGQPGPPASTPPAAAVDGGEATKTGAPPPLDEAGPRIDLLAGRHLFHLEDEGLVVPLAGEGLWKYVPEYTNPWGRVVEVEGHRGRALIGRAATLALPLFAPAQEVVVRVHAASRGARLSLNLDGRPLRIAPLVAGWQEVRALVPSRAGQGPEARLLLQPGGKGLLFHSVSFGSAVTSPAVVAAGSATPAPPGPWPADGPVARVALGGDERPALVGFRRYRMLLEVPAAGWLAVATGSRGEAARVRIEARAEGGAAATVLLDEAQAAGAWAERRLDLGRFAGKLILLTLTVAAGAVDAVAWAAPRVLCPPAATRTRPPPVRNVIVLIGDALRADRLALYGETRVKTPRLTESGRSHGVALLGMQAASPSSPPSHASIQSGMTPRRHGVGGDKAKLNPGTRLLSTVLGAAGVTTGYYGNNPFGMNRLREAGRWREFHNLASEGKGADCGAIVKEVLAYAERESRAGRRFFASTIAFEPHTPYLYRAGLTEHYFKGPYDPLIGKAPDGNVLGPLASGRLPFTAERRAQLTGLYDGEVEYMDGCFGRLVDGLKERGLGDDTALVITGDHGEGFGEHGGFGHAFGHWAEVANVPLLLLSPGLTPRGVALDFVASHLDIAPTILDLMGLPPDEGMQGESLLPVVLRDGAAMPRMVPLEYGRSYALRSPGYRYIVDYNGKEMLYDQRADPIEARDLVASAPLPLRYARDRAGFYRVFRDRWRMASWGSFAQHGPAIVDAVGVGAPSGR